MRGRFGLWSQQFLFGWEEELAHRVMFTKTSLGEIAILHGVAVDAPVGTGIVLADVLMMHNIRIRDGSPLARRGWSDLRYQIGAPHPRNVPV